MPRRSRLFAPCIETQRVSSPSCTLNRRSSIGKRGASLRRKAPSGAFRNTSEARGLVALADDLNGVIARRLATSERVRELRAARVRERHVGTLVLRRDVRAEADVAGRGA